LTYEDVATLISLSAQARDIQIQAKAEELDIVRDMVNDTRFASPSLEFDVGSEEAAGKPSTVTPQSISTEPLSQRPLKSFKKRFAMTPRRKVRDLHSPCHDPGLVFLTHR